MEPCDFKRLKLSLEPHIETVVRSVLSDGKEEYIQEKSPQEKLLELANKIDFYAEVKQEYTSERGLNENGDPRLGSGFDPNIFHAIQQKILHAQSEIEVLVDLLALANTGKYMKSMQVAQNKDTSQDVSFRLAAKLTQIESSVEYLRNKSKLMRSIVSNEKGFYNKLISFKSFAKMRHTGRNMFVDVPTLLVAPHFLEI
eukprot:Sdes_comp20031_c0_seq1m12794